MDLTNLDQHIKNVTDSYLNNKTASCVDVRHNNRLLLIVVGMVAVLILLLGIIWLWNAPENYRFIIKLVITVFMIAILGFLLNFTYKKIY